MESPEYQEIVMDAAFTHRHEVGGGLLFVALLIAGLVISVRQQAKKS